MTIIIHTDERPNFAVIRHLNSRRRAICPSCGGYVKLQFGYLKAHRPVIKSWRHRHPGPEAGSQ